MNINFKKSDSSNKVKTLTLKDFQKISNIAHQLSYAHPTWDEEKRMDTAFRIYQNKTK